MDVAVTYSAHSYRRRVVFVLYVSLCIGCSEMAVDGGIVRLAEVEVGEDEGFDTEAGRKVEGECG